MALLLSRCLKFLMMNFTSKYMLHVCFTNYILRLDQLEAKNEQQEVKDTEQVAKVVDLDRKVAENEIKINNPKVEMDQLKKNSDLGGKTIN